MNPTNPLVSWPQKLASSIASLALPALFLSDQMQAEETEAPEITRVGAYYYPWFEEHSGPEGNNWENNVMRTLLKEKQLPRLGHYDSASPAVIKDHIAQSLRGGIDFWAVSWWGPNTDTDKNFREAILPHPDAAKLKYAVLYESPGRLGSLKSPRYDNWLSDFEYLKEHYFSNPSYLKIDGKPVVFVYLTRVYFRNQGDDALAGLRKQFPEVYLVGDDVFFTSGKDYQYKGEWARRFDAVTTYDIYGQSVGPLGGTREAIDFLAGNYAQAKKEANRVGTAFIPAVAPGYNDTAVREGHPGRARYFSDKKDSKEGDVFREMIRKAALPNLDPMSDSIMMVTSFNEWYEDSQVEATRGSAGPSSTDISESGTDYTGGQVYNDYGFLYLDILKEETETKATDTKY